MTVHKGFPFLAFVLVATVHLSNGFVNFYMEQSESFRFLGKFILVGDAGSAKFDNCL